MCWSGASATTVGGIGLATGLWVGRRHDRRMGLYLAVVSLVQAVDALLWRVEAADGLDACTDANHRLGLLLLGCVQCSWCRSSCRGGRR